jgi:eukaryotic-like serine/threonine-protein kinase
VTEALDFEACVVIRRLKQGPVYDLYLARHRELERQVLIKALQGLVARTSPAADALEREAHLLARLDHHNVVRALDFVRRDDRVWLVLEHEPGVSLAELLEQRAPIDARTAALIALCLARALAHLHTAGAVHQGLGPSAVWLGERGRVRLTGFEHASSDTTTQSSEELAAVAASLETAYLSPEQVLGAPPRPESDVFSLGALLYRLLAGRPPFAGKDAAGLRQAIHRDAPAPLETALPISPALSRLVQRCLEKEPEQRFASGGELERQLDAVLEHPPDSEIEASVLGLLTRSGVAVPNVPAAAEPRASRQDAERSLRRSVGALVATGVVMVAGGLVIHRMAHQDPLRVDVRQNLPPTAYGALRVVAEPWAYVYVDGKLMETTPFANPLLLTPGVHHVRLEHPSAAPERREIVLAPNQSLLLDVRMKLTGAAVTDAGAPPATLSERPDAGARRR